MFHSSVSEEVGLFWGRSTCLYSRHAWGCIIVAIVLGLRWSANSLSTEERKINWPQLANCRPGRVCLLYVVGKQRLYKNYRLLYWCRRKLQHTLRYLCHHSITFSLQNRFSQWTRWLVLTPMILRVISNSTLHFQHYSCPVRMRQWGDQWPAL